MTERVHRCAADDGETPAAHRDPQFEPTPQRKVPELPSDILCHYALGSWLIAAWAAASRATGTRKGEQLT